MTEQESYISTLNARIEELEVGVQEIIGVLSAAPTQKLWPRIMAAIEIATEALTLPAIGELSGDDTNGRKDCNSPSSGVRAPSVGEHSQAIKRS